MAKRYPPKLKFQVVLELLKGDKTPSQAARAYNVHPNSAGLWKREFLEKGPEIFSFCNLAQNVSSWDSCMAITQTCSQIWLIKKSRFLASLRPYIIPMQNVMDLNGFQLKSLLFNTESLYERT